MDAKSYWPFKIGLLFVVASWFSFTLYQLSKSIFNGIDVSFTDVPATIGLSFRAAAAFIALSAILLYLFRRGTSVPEILASVRWILLLEAAYWFSLFPSAIWGFTAQFPRYPRELFIVGTGAPCLAESIVMPVVLGALFLKLSSKKPVEGAIKWGLVAGAANIFVLWLNYTGQWWSDIILSGFSVISAYPMNAAVFAITVGGLLLLTIYAGMYAKKSFGTETVEGLNVRKAGAIITAFGLYFDVVLLLWLLLGSVSGESISQTFFVHHNMDLWLLSLPLVGLPLILFKKKPA
jgi:hypothetical protein